MSTTRQRRVKRRKRCFNFATADGRPGRKQQRFDELLPGFVLVGSKPDKAYKKALKEILHEKTKR